MLTGINIPPRIGNATVVPWDRREHSGSSRRWTCASTNRADSTAVRAIRRLQKELDEFIKARQQKK
jgi:hypothetical protein